MGPTDARMLAGRVLGAQIYVYPSFEDIPDTIPLLTNDFFVNQTTGQVYSYVTDEHGDGSWVYKFTIPNNDLLISNEQRIAAVEAYFLNGKAKQAIADSHGVELNAADYASKSGDNRFLGNNEFDNGVSAGGDVKLTREKIEVFTTKDNFSVVFTKETAGQPTQHVTFRFPYDANDRPGDNFDLATLSQVAAAVQAALTTAEGYSDAKLAAAVAAILGSPNFTGNVRVGGDLIVDGKMVYVESETVSTESRYIQLIKGNSVPVVGYVGIVVPHYNEAGNDFFLGMDGGIIVFGKVQATFGPKGEVVSVSNVSTIPLLGRAPHELLVNGNVLIWDAEHKKAVDGGMNPSQIAADEVIRQANEANRVGAETARNAAASVGFKTMPRPMSMAEYNHIKNDGWYYSLLPNGTQVVSQTPPIDAVFSFQYQPTAVYTPYDDPYFADAMAVIEEAKDYLENQIFLTAEQYAEMERQGLLGDKNVYIEDPELYTLLTVTIPAAEEQRQLNENVRVSFLEWQITKYPWPVSAADMVKLSANGVFGVHMTGSGTSQTPVCTVYDSLALAEAAGETWKFPMQSDVVYPSLD